MWRLNLVLAATFMRLVASVVLLGLLAVRIAAQDKEFEGGYPTGHDLNDPKVLIDRASWLESRIGLRSFRGLLAAYIATP